MTKEQTDKWGRFFGIGFVVALSLGVGRCTAPERGPWALHVVPAASASAPAVTMEDLRGLHARLDNHEHRIVEHRKELEGLDRRMITYNEMTMTLLEKVVPMRAVGKPIEFRATKLSDDAGAP